MSWPNLVQIGLRGFYNICVGIGSLHIMDKRPVVNHLLENVAIANALQLEAARRRAAPIRFNFAQIWYGV